MNALHLANRTGLAIVLSAAFPLPVYAQTVTYNGGGFNIPDTGQRSSTITVAPPTGARQITNVTASLNGLSHSYASDLSGNISFAGRQTSIFQNDGGDSSISGNYSFADSAPNAPFGTGNTAAGSYRPFTPFSTFNGLSGAGNWTLLISDDYPGDTGNLNSWSLSITYAAAAPEPSSWAFMILGFGIVGGTLRRRRRKVAPLYRATIAV